MRWTAFLVREMDVGRGFFFFFLNNWRFESQVFEFSCFRQCTYIYVYRILHKTDKKVSCS